MKKTILAVLAMGALSCALFSQQTQAAPITGTISLGGAVRFDTNSLATATKVNIWFDDQNNAGHSTVQAGNTGDFSGDRFGTQATMHNGWKFNPSTPTPGLWSVGGFTFDLASSTIVTQTASFLSVSGTGIVSGNGFDANSDGLGFHNPEFGRAHTSSILILGERSAVPDGGATVMLLGAALGSLGIARRFLKK